MGAEGVGEWHSLELFTQCPVVDCPGKLLVGRHVRQHANCLNPIEAWRDVVHWATVAENFA